MDEDLDKSMQSAVILQSLGNLHECSPSPIMDGLDNISYKMIPPTNPPQNVPPCSFDSEMNDFHQRESFPNPNVNVVGNMNGFQMEIVNKQLDKHNDENRDNGLESIYNFFLYYINLQPR